MNLELLGATAVLIILVIGYIFLKQRPFRVRNDKFVWQPDLSHKVIVHEAPPSNFTSRAREQRITLVEKTPAELAEELRSYLKENQND